MHLSFMGAASIPPSWNSSSRWEHQGELTKSLDLQHQPAAAAPVHHVHGGTEGKEQPETWRSRRRGTTEKCSETCVWRTSAREGFPAGSVFDPTLIPNNGICEGDAGEFDSTSGGEETRGRQSAAKGNTSMTKTRSRSPRGEL